MFHRILRKLNEAAEGFGIIAGGGKMEKVDAARRQMSTLELVKTLETPSNPTRSPHIPASNEMEVYDFSEAGWSMLVTHSDHWKEHASANLQETEAIGMITRCHFFADAKGRIVAYPSVRWEGKVSSSMTHPIHLKPWRPSVVLKKVTVDDGQYGFAGPNSIDDQESPHIKTNE